MVVLNNTLDYYVKQDIKIDFIKLIEDFFDKHPGLNNILLDNLLIDRNFCSNNINIITLK